MATPAERLLTEKALTDQYTPAPQPVALPLASGVTATSLTYTITGGIVEIAGVAVTVAAGVGNICSLPEALRPAKTGYVYGLIGHDASHALATFQIQDPGGQLVLRKTTPQTSATYFLLRWNLRNRTKI